MYSRAHARLLKEDHGLALLDAPRVRAPITDEHATTDDLETTADGRGCVKYGGISQGSSDDTAATAQYIARMCAKADPCIHSYTSAILPTSGPLEPLSRDPAHPDQ